MAKTNKTQTVIASKEQTKDNGGNVTAAVDPKPDQKSEKTLDPTEEKLLKSCEEAIASGIKSSFEMGESLQTILDQRLYRKDYSSFDEYCSERWDMSGSHARRLIDEAKVRSKLQDEFSPKGEKPLPRNEAQARPLATLDENQWVGTWKRIVEKSEEDDQPITGEFVEAFVSSLAAGDGKERKSKSKKPAAENNSVVTKILGFITAVKKQLKSNNKDKVAELLNELRRFVREHLAKANQK